MKGQRYDSYRSFRFTRRSLRLPNYNYRSAGAYFVTIRAKVPEPIFEIPALRAILTDTWIDLPKRFPSISLDEFVVMPDHIHFIVLLNDASEKMPTLSDIVRVYKSITTLAWLHHIETAALNYPGRFWQRNYFERIIRNVQELEHTRQYIRDNPSKLHMPTFET